MSQFFRGTDYTHNCTPTDMTLTHTHTLTSYTHSHMFGLAATVKGTFGCGGRWLVWLQDGPLNLPSRSGHLRPSSQASTGTVMHFCFLLPLCMACGPSCPADGQGFSLVMTLLSQQRVGVRSFVRHPTLSAPPVMIRVRAA